MTGQLRSDRLRLLRHADRNSIANQKLRKAAFNILFAICKAFIPEPHNFRGFAFGRLPWGFIIAGPQSDPSPADLRTCVVLKQNGRTVMGFVKEGALPENGMLSFGDAEFIAERIGYEGISKVLDELEFLRGREAAVALMKELGLPSRDAS